MKTFLTLLFATGVVCASFAQSRYWIAASNANWNDVANWSTASGGAGGASVPGAGNLAIFDANGIGNCNLDIAPTVGGITIAGFVAAIDLQGNILTTTGVNTFTTGTIQNSGAAAGLVINSTGLTTFGGTAFQVAVSGNSGRILFNGSVFNQPLDMVKTGATNDAGTGGNTFNNTVALGCSGSAQLQLATVNPDIFNGVLTINSNGTSAIQLARNAAGNQFNESILINYNSTGTISFGNNGGTSSLADTRTITVSSFGASGCGALVLAGFTQVGSTSQVITLAGNTTAALTIGSGSTFNGDLTVSSPSIILNASTFEGNVDLTKTGTNTDNQRGGNIFNGTFTLNNQGADFIFGSNAADAGDTWNGLATFNNTGGNRIRVSEQTAGNLFTAPAIFNCLGGSPDVADRIQISRLAGGETTFNSTATFNNAGATSDMQISYDAGSITIFNDDVFFNAATTGGAENYIAVDGIVQLNADIIFTNTSTTSIYTALGSGSVSLGTGTIGIGGAGFATGQLRLLNFTQTGANPQSITLTGTAILRVGPGSAFQGDVNFISPQVYLDGCTYNGVTYIEKTGASTNTSNGGNDFNGVTTLVNSSNASWEFANVNPDIFDNTLTVNNTGAERIQLALNSAGTTFNGAVTFNHGGTSATGNSFIVARNAGSSATFNNTLNLNCTNGNVNSGIVIGYTGTININANVIMTNTGRGVFFSSNGGSTTLADGFTLSTAGVGTFTTGTLSLARFAQVGSLAQSIALEGTATMVVGPTSSFDADVDFRAPQFFLQGATYNGVTYIEKTGATNNASNGGNTFNGATTLVNSGSGYLLTSNTAPDVFNSTLDVLNTGSSIIYLAYNMAGNEFNEDVTFTSSGSSQGIWIGANNGTSVLGSGASLLVGAGGFSEGILRIRRLTQIGPDPQSLLLTNTALLELGPASTFNGTVDFRSPQLELDGATFNGVTYLEKSGATDNAGNGGNIFNGATTLVNSGSGYLLTANVTADAFNNTLDVINTGSNIIYLAHNVNGTVFNGDVTFTSTGSSQGIRLGSNATGTSTIANGVSLLVGGGGFTSGILRLRRLTQIGADDQTILLTGTALMELGPATTFNGNVDFRAPQFELDGTTFNGTTYIEKTGATTNDSNGGNVFNGTTTIVNSGINYFRFAQTALDVFNGDLILSSTGSSTLRLADGVPGTVFNGNIQVNSINSSGGIYFGDQATSGATLAATKTITIGSLGFTVGDLRLKRFVQTGATSQILSLTGTGRIVIGPTSTFDGDIDFRAPNVYLDGGTFNGTAFLQKNGTGDDTGPGNNIFNSTTTLENTNANYFMTGNTTRDIFNGALTLTNTSSGSIRLANNSIGNEFNSNVLVNNTGSGQIYIGNTGGSSTLANGFTIGIGGSGFAQGELRIRRLTQTGLTPQAITLTGTGLLRVGTGTEFNGTVNFVSPQLYLDGATYNNTTYLEKNGASNNDHVGGNIFNGTTTVVNSSAARMRLAGTNGDTFSGAVTFIKSSTGALEVAYNLVNLFSGDITLNSNTALTFASGTGTVQFSGSASQVVSKTGGTPSPIFRRMTIDKTSGTVTLATDVSVSVASTFTNGVMITDATNYLNIGNGATTTGASDLSYVDGPVRKTGADAFTFPTGDNGFYRPIGISAPTAAAHYFQAQYFNAVQGFGNNITWDPSFVTLSGCEYWILDRNSGASSDVFVTLSWNENACEPGYITDLPTLRVSRWNGTNWVDHGNGSTTGTAINGTITSSAAVTSFSPFTLASTSAINPLPVELSKFWAVNNPASVTLNWITASELNNDKFTLQRSSNGKTFYDIYELEGAGTTKEETRYQYVDETPLAGLSYYRLKQTDFDGKEEYPERGIISVRREDEALTCYPNPVGEEILHFNKPVSFVIFNSMEYVVGEATDVTEYSMRSLPSGFYVIQTSSGEVLKIIKK